MSIRVEWGAATHVGSVRSANQDSILAGPTVFAVADGMGGHAAGEVASAIAVAQMAHLEAGASGWEVLSTVIDAHREVCAQGAHGSGREGMGTTISGFAIATNDGQQAVLVFNVGDSRTYVLEERSLRQVTSDHSMVAEMVRNGELSPDEAKGHHGRNVVTRALGVGDEVQVDHWWCDPRVGQVFLSCSDGLTNEVSDAVIEGVLRAAGSPQAAVDSLVGIALDSGARDNLSVIAVRIEEVTEDATAIDDDTSKRPVADLATDARSVIDEDTTKRPVAPTVPIEASAELSVPGDRVLIHGVPGAGSAKRGGPPSSSVDLVTGIPSGDGPTGEG